MAEVRGMIEDLDPLEHDAEITHLSLEVRTPPMFAHAAYASGTARGLIHPGEAAVGYRGGTGEQLLHPEHRDRDTLTFFGMFMRYGHRSRQVREVLDRVQQIHHDVRGVTNDTQLHVLGLLMTEPDRWVGSFGHRTYFTRNERLARYSFWRGIGEGMGLTGIWDDPDEVEPWVDAFEAKFGRPTNEAHQLWRGQVDGFRVWFPRRSQRLAAAYLGAGLTDKTRECVGAEPRSAMAHRTLRAGIQAYLTGEPKLRTNLSRTWVGSFSRFGAQPDIHTIGYQHDVAADPRYLRAGAPEDGYTFTVADGVRSKCPVSAHHQEESA